MSLQGFDVLYATAGGESFAPSAQQTSLFDFANPAPEKGAIPSVEKKVEKSDFSLPVSPISKTFSSTSQIVQTEPKTQSPLPSAQPVASISKISVSPSQVSYSPFSKKSASVAVQTITPEVLVQEKLSLFVQNSRAKIKNGLGEVRLFAGIFLAVLVVFYFFTNAQLIAVLVQDAFSNLKTQSLPAATQMLHNAAPKQAQKAVLNLEEKINTLNFSQGKELSVSMQEFLKQKEENQTLDFNLLPPTNRLIIPDLNLNVPLVDSEIDASIDVAENAFDHELEKGVVKYPSTPTPGSKGNTLLFGHSSTEWWKKNEYGFVFRHLPKLKVGQRFQVIWNGQLITYEMVERKVVLPKNVVDYYNLFAEKNESYLTLMGCYPIGTADKRMMVVAKKVENAVR